MWDVEKCMEGKKGGIIAAFIFPVTDHSLYRQFICRATPVIPLGLGDLNW
jgi:hypothetical protein